jgi:predicted XRE-type DNA-binding protein
MISKDDIVLMKEIEMIGKVQLSLVKGFEEMADYYQVETDGDRCWVTSINGKVLKASVNSHGYRQYVLYLKSGKQKTILEHRLFAICFLNNSEDKEQVNHIDGNKSNNLLSNLEWMTPKENTQHAFRTGLSKLLFGDKARNMKLRDSEIHIIFNMRKTGMTQKAIGLHFGVSQSQISAILLGKSRSQS